MRQIALLKAIAGDPGLPVFSSAFLGRHSLSQGMVQKALPKLVRLDLIEKSEQNTWHIVDPLLEDWLTR